MNPPIIVFNGPWFAAIAVLIAFGIALYLVGRRLTAAGRKRLLVGAALVNWVCFGLYMFGLSSQGEFPPHVLQAMPLQLCSLVTFALIPAIVLPTKILRGFCYFIGCLSGFLALMSPATGIEGVGVLTPLAVGFFGSHGLNVVIGALIAALGLYRPSYRAALTTLGWFVVLVALMAVTNLVLRSTIAPNVNYFYFFDPEGAEILVALHNWFKIPVLYLFPIAPLVVGALMAQAAIYKGGSRLAGRAARWRQAGAAVSAASS
jgi:uncharacterized membrane protein YwaF